MFSPAALLTVMLAYAVALFAIAIYAERRVRAGATWSTHPVVHSLVLAVYCSTWTFYGSVGKATTDGPLFLAIYLGPTLALLGGSQLMQRIVALKDKHRITSLADFVSSRYGKSQRVAALVTVLLVLGIVPYLALQLKAVTSTFALLTRGRGAHLLVSPIVVALLVAFTIVFGMRRLDPSERHPGIVVSLAVEAVVKLAAFFAAGVFVLGLAFGGVSGFVTQLSSRAAEAQVPHTDVATWLTYLVLSASAFAFLPRQFHVGVIESAGPRSVRTSMWLVPLYLFAINLFVLPIALAGPAFAPAGSSPDHYVLSIPLSAGRAALSLTVFLGGFSAAVGMVIVETMAMTTMISNHLLLPVVEWVPLLRPLRRDLLRARWGIATTFLVAAYAFELTIGDSYMLVATGILAFAAVVQCAPVILGGLAWRRASARGALLGLALGGAAWFYTLIVPTFVRSGWLPGALLTRGPFGIGLLRPEAFFGMRGLPALVHGVGWSLGLNVAGYVLGSLLFPPGAEEARLADEFLGVSVAVARAPSTDDEVTLDAAEKRARLAALLTRYFPVDEARSRISAAFRAASVKELPRLTAAQHADVREQVELSLAGSIGAAAAHAAIDEVDPIDEEEARRLGVAYARVLAELRVPPAELRRRIDFHREREALLEQQAKELEEKMSERDREIAARKKAEAALRRAHDESFRALIESSPDAICVLDAELVTYENRAASQLFSSDGTKVVGRPLSELIEPEDWAPLARLTPTPWREVRLRSPRGPRVAEVALLSTVFDGRPAIVFMAHDVTETRALHAQVMQADRLASMGTLAAGVAHEINNPLTWVLGSLAQAREDLDARAGSDAGLSRVRSLVVEAQDGAERVVKIARDLTAFTRPTESGRARADLEAVLARAATMASHEIRHRATLVTELEATPKVAADPVQLGQVFLNLLINAAQSIREGAAAENRITVRARRIPGERVEVEVEDTGEGIAEESLPRLFDAYFTTKPVGVGTGLGLYICRRIVQSFDGTLDVTSVRGKGSTFRVTVPLASDVPGPTALPPPRTASRAPPPPAGRTLKILVCDDEEAVARALVRMLRPHAVTVAHSGRAALEALRRDASFDLVFCDLMMPDMTGIDLHEHLVREPIYDVARIVFMTGGTFTTGAREFLDRLPNRVIDKPFDTPLLRQILAEAASAAAEEDRPS